MHPGAGIKSNPDRQSRWIALCCGAMIAAFYVVGLVSGTELRHFVQTLPLWLGVIFGIRRVQMTVWLAMPMFLFWLVVMVLIWLFLLGWAHVVSGHFSPVGILMTLVIGAASVLGITFCIRDRGRTKTIAATAVALIGAIAQLIAFQVSFLPGIAIR